MNTKPLRRTFILALIATSLFGHDQKAEVSPALSKDTEAAAREMQALETGIEAYIYAYPLVQHRQRS